MPNSIQTAYLCRFINFKKIIQKFKKNKIKKKMLILAEHLCKFPFLLNICANFHSCCIFCKILFRLHICANFLSCCIFFANFLCTHFLVQLSILDNCYDRHRNRLRKAKYTWQSLVVASFTVLKFTSSHLQQY